MMAVHSLPSSSNLGSWTANPLTTHSHSACPACCLWFSLLSGPISVHPLHSLMATWLHSRRTCPRRFSLALQRSCFAASVCFGHLLRSLDLWLRFFCQQDCQFYHFRVSTNWWWKHLAYHWIACLPWYQCLFYYCDRALSWSLEILQTRSGG